MSVGRFASAIVAGMLAGGLVAMSGVGRAHAAEPPVAIEMPAPEVPLERPTAATATHIRAERALR